MDVRNLGVLREFNKRASVLIETGFVTNGDRTKLISNADDVGKQIATGIYTFINNKPPPTPNAVETHPQQIVKPIFATVEIKKEAAPDHFVDVNQMVRIFLLYRFREY